MIHRDNLFLVLNPDGDDALFWKQRLVTHGATARLFCALCKGPQTKKTIIERVPSFRANSGGFFNRLAHYFEKHDMPFVLTRSKAYGRLTTFFVAAEPTKERVR